MKNYVRLYDLEANCFSKRVNISVLYGWLKYRYWDKSGGSKVKYIKLMRKLANPNGNFWSRRSTIRLIKWAGSYPRSAIKTKYEKKYFLGDFLSADFWQKFWERISLPWKSFPKICGSEASSNCRSCKSRIKLIHTTWVVWRARS